MKRFNYIPAPAMFDLVWPKNSNGGRTCTSQGDQACQRAELGRWVAKLLPRSPIAARRIAKSEFQD